MYTYLISTFLGIVEMQSLMRFDQKMYELAITRPIPDTIFVFVLSNQFNLMPGFYNSRHVFNLLECQAQIVNVANTSYQVFSTARSLVTREVLYTNLTCLVLVDSKVRRPTPIPKDLKESMGSQKHPWSPVKRLKIPNDAHRLSYRVRTSDLEWSRRINAAYHSRICQDAMYDASISGAFRGLSGDLGHYWIRQVKSLYMNETHAGDDLDILVWQDEGCDWLLNAVIQKQGKDVYQVSVEYSAPGTPEFARNSKL